MQYVVKGKIFDDVEEAKKYEKELKAKEDEKVKRQKEEKQDLEVLKEYEKEYVERVNDFYKKYGYYSVDLSGLPNSFDRLFDDFGFGIFKH